MLTNNGAFWSPCQAASDIMRFRHQQTGWLGNAARFLDIRKSNFYTNKPCAEFKANVQQSMTYKFKTYSRI